jgi:predicted transcriptional regulator
MLKMFTTKLDEELISQVKKLSVETRISQTKLIAEAIQDLIKKYSKE